MDSSSVKESAKIISDKKGKDLKIETGFKVLTK